MSLSKGNQSGAWYWVGAASITIILRILLPAPVIEQYYSRGLFLYIRSLFDYTTGLLPFPTLYILLLALLIFLIKKLRSKSLTGQKPTRRLLFFLKGLLGILSAVVFLFLLLWGFNYGRVSIEEQLGFEPEPLDYFQLTKELEQATEELIYARSLIPGITDSALQVEFIAAEDEDEIRRELKTCLNGFGYPTPGKVRGRLLHPKGSLLRISTAGVYLPWVGEGHIDPGLHPIQIPFVMAHEMSHGYGFGDEGTCNFTAYLALANSENPIFAYSARLGYWNYLARAVYGYDPEAYRDFYLCLPVGVRADRRAIIENGKKYPDIFPVARDAFYNQYLKTQGIKEGIKNYSRVVMLGAAWRKKNYGNKQD